MSTNYWIGSTSVDPQNSQNWSTRSVPTTGDTVIFGEMAVSTCWGDLSVDPSSSGNPPIYLKDVIVEEDFPHDYTLGTSEIKMLTINAENVTISRPASNTRFNEYYLNFVETAESSSEDDFSNVSLTVVGGQWGSGSSSPMSFEIGNENSPEANVTFGELSSSRLYIEGIVDSITLKGDTIDNPILGTVELHGDSGRPSVCSSLTTSGHSTTDNSNSLDNFTVLIGSGRTADPVGDDPLDTLNLHTLGGVNVYSFVASIVNVDVRPANRILYSSARNFLVLANPYGGSSLHISAPRPIQIDQLMTHTQPQYEQDDAILRDRLATIDSAQDVFAVFASEIDTLIMAGGYLRFFVNYGPEFGDTLQQLNDCYLAHRISDGILTGNSVIKPIGAEVSNTVNRFFVDNLQIRSGNVLVALPQMSYLQISDTDMNVVPECTDCYTDVWSSDEGSSGPYWSSDDVGSSNDWFSSEDIDW